MIMALACEHRTVQVCTVVFQSKWSNHQKPCSPWRVLYTPTLFPWWCHSVLRAVAWCVCARARMCSCMQQINKANRGDITPEELKERQAKAMADPEIQAILTDPVMRQVRPPHLES